MVETTHQIHEVTIAQPAQSPFGHILTPLKRDVLPVLKQGPPFGSTEWQDTTTLSAEVEGAETRGNTHLYQNQTGTLNQRISVAVIVHRDFHNRSTSPPLIPGHTIIHTDHTQMFNQILDPHDDINASPIAAVQLYDEDCLGRVGDEESISVQRPQAPAMVDVHGRPPTGVPWWEVESSRIRWVATCDERVEYSELWNTHVTLGGQNHHSEFVEEGDPRLPSNQSTPVRRPKVE